MAKTAKNKKQKIEAVDLFCGAGGLTYGLRQAGIKVKAGVDLDPACRYPYEANNKKSKFIEADISKVSADDLSKFYSKDAIRLLAGCAPCQPFSTLANGNKGPNDEKWGLLEEFARLVKELKPELVTMENVPRVTNHPPYKAFIETLTELGYEVHAKRVRCANYGIPQERRRFVLVASLFGSIELPEKVGELQTVHDAIAHLPPLKSGETSSSDPLHKARSLSPVNLKRIKASKPGGSWLDWPKSLRAPCHQVERGASFQSVYARMTWDAPSPTITTQSFNFGTGRFGHPSQDRAITLREAAIFQSFPDDYKFVEPDATASFSTVGRLIGNAVPPKLGEVVGNVFIQHINECLKH